MEFRYMTLEERPLVDALQRKHKIVAEFHSRWTLWHNWDARPPLLAWDGNAIAGLYAYAFTKSGYVNSYYIWVDDAYRGMGVAGGMVDFMLKEALDHGAKRYKSRMPTGKDGEKFWRGFGVKPCGWIPDLDEQLYDYSIEGVGSIHEFIVNAPTSNDIPTTDKRSLSHYMRLGVIFTDPHWLHLNG